MTPRYSGDGWELYVGDCLAVLPGLTGVDAVVTDPPYGIGYGGRQSVGGTAGRRKAYWRDWSTDWDESRIEDNVLLAVVSSASHAIVWGGNNYQCLPPSNGWLVWDKTQRELSFGDGELAWTNCVNSVRLYSLNRVAVTCDGKQHPTQKPVALMEWCLSFLPNAETILDPFAGSGTTGVACIKTGRRFIGIEIDEHYAQIAAKRLASAEADVRNSLPFPEPEPRPKQAAMWEAV